MAHRDFPSSFITSDTRHLCVLKSNLPISVVVSHLSSEKQMRELNRKFLLCCLQSHKVFINKLSIEMFCIEMGIRIIEVTLWNDSFPLSLSISSFINSTPPGDGNAPTEASLDKLDCSTANNLTRFEDVL